VAWKGHRIPVDAPITTPPACRRIYAVVSDWIASTSRHVGPLDEGRAFAERGLTCNKPRPGGMLTWVAFEAVLLPTGLRISLLRARDIESV